MAPFKFQEKAMETLISTETDEGINNIADAFIKKNIGEKLIENNSNDQHVIKNKIITSIKISKINGLKQVGDDIRTMIFETKGRLRNTTEPDRVYNIGKSEVFLRNNGKMYSKRLIDENSNNITDIIPLIHPHRYGHMITIEESMCTGDHIVKLPDIFKSFHSSTLDAMETYSSLNPPGAYFNYSDIIEIIKTYPREELENNNIDDYVSRVTESKLFPIVSMLSSKSSAMYQMGLFGPYNKENTLKISKDIYEAILNNDEYILLKNDIIMSELIFKYSQEFMDTSRSSSVIKILKYLSKRNDVGKFIETLINLYKHEDDISRNFYEFTELDESLRRLETVSRQIVDLETEKRVITPRINQSLEKEEIKNAFNKISDYFGVNVQDKLPIEEVFEY